MNRKTFLHIVEWSVALAACAYLVWRIATYDDYGSLWNVLRTMNVSQWLAIVVCMALMPVNMALETWKWQTLMPMPWSEARRQVYYSKLAGLTTPWRLGEYPARGLLMEESKWPQVLSMGIVGSATMTAAIIIAGVVCLAFSPKVFTLLGGSYLYSLLAVVLLLMLLFLILPKALKRYVTVNSDLLIRSTGQSFVRLACWCVQLGLVLYALGGYDTLIDLVLKTPLYYLFVTLTPNVPIVEAGVRGAWAIAVFGTMNAALAGVLLWIVNTLLPCLIWPFLRKK